jgi:hypothetical protein
MMSRYATEDTRTPAWPAVSEVLRGGEDPTTWLKEGARLGFTPNLIPDTFRATNRPTFQQVLEFVPETTPDEG